MPNVHILPPDIVSKIAAGEIIDRPASVLKELIENSLDAQANSISIELADAGKSLIRIRDNGTGIDPDDLETIFARHSTSKIASIDDLFDIHSLGFRGEALYSICAVSDITVRSKTASADSGWEIHMRGGKKLDLKPVAMQNGTEIEVKELFFNTPARRKFLKSGHAEISTVLGVLIPYTLLYPNCRFRLTHGTKTLIDVAAADRIKDRLGNVLNLNSQFFIEVDRELAQENIHIHLIAGDINIIRTKRDMQFIFINGRPVQSKAISFHLNDVYRLILPPRHYPFFFIAITIPAGDIDVNVHPTKREVKVRDENALCSLIRRICESALMNASRPKQIWSQDQASSLDANPGEPRASIKDMIGSALARREHDEDLSGKSFSGEISAQPQQPTEQYTFPQENFSSEFVEHLTAQKKGTLRQRLESGRFIGAFLQKYLFFESGPALLIIDQHAAQERIRFEQLIAQMNESAVEIQNLLTPYLLELSPQEILIWEHGKDVLEKIGFETTQFDGQTIAVQTCPVLIKNPEYAVRELLGGGDIARCDHETLARRACRSSVMAGDRLSEQQAEFQREQLLQCKDPFTCPHGRPTIIEINVDFLNKQFLRNNS